MKRYLVITFLILTNLTTKAQNVVYLFGMNSSGQPVINSIAIPGVVNSGSFLDLSNIPTLFTTPIPHNNVTRAINGAAFTISTTKPAWVYYTVNISCTATIGSTALGKVSLQYSTDAGSTWIDISDVSNSNTVTLAIALQSVNAQDMVVSGYIPANALVRINNTVTGTTVNTYICGQENY